MPNIFRRRHQLRRDLGPYKRHELLTGKIDYPILSRMHRYYGYGDGKSKDMADYINDEMKADWLANRDELLVLWKSGEYIADIPWLIGSGSPDTVPWAEEQFGDGT